MKLYRGAMVNSVMQSGREWFKYSGEKRPPKKGEYYLSGAIPEVYRAPNDLSSVFHIMVHAPTPPQTLTQNGLTYRLSTI